MADIMIPSTETINKVLGVYDFRIENIGRGDKDVFSGILKMGSHVSTSIAVLSYHTGVDWGNLERFLIYKAAVLMGFTFPEEQPAEIEPPVLQSEPSDDIHEIANSLSGSEEEGDSEYSASIFDTVKPVVTEAVNVDEVTMDAFEDDFDFDLFYQPVVVEPVVACATVSEPIWTDTVMSAPMHPDLFNAAMLAGAAELTRDFIPMGKLAYTWIPEIPSETPTEPEISPEFNPTITIDEEGNDLFLNPEYPKQSDGRYICRECSKPVNHNEIHSIVELGANAPYHPKCWPFATENELVEEEEEETPEGFPNLGTGLADIVERILRENTVSPAKIAWDKDPINPRGTITKDAVYWSDMIDA